ncbi:hypothetical protein FVER53590_09338 [Fusarium verticillioides]|nr:hypothetical protein FVER53590_09338 [Fusarium verticillioides]
MRCAGCTDAPDYDPGDSTTVVYCDRDCQKKHWSEHKSRCRVMKQRKILLRAATILRSALLTYREIRYDIDLTNIEAKDEMLCLYQNQRAATSRVKWGSFPDHLTSNVQHREAALTINQCTMATALLSRLTSKLLAGVHSNAQVLDIKIGKPLLPPKLIPGPDLSNCPHTVIKVGLLSSTESWVIDTAGQGLPSRRRALALQLDRNERPGLFLYPASHEQLTSPKAGPRGGAKGSVALCRLR